ncbi:MAG TPA: nucleotidyltransferase domain-containing protein [Marmoricola sp.]|jgi:predicted nucleotidyltransferase|nr:nucleotidyltransferase domain-containing protein [Nocardioidaceae bacterium]MCO5324876.1 nucleotidyltransferase domain-containing protein [Nocardioidaceae bacterium]HRV69155.1 nucleotidyltransferase domain-containing protein [Marmoricola sp.]
MDFGQPFGGLIPGAQGAVLSALLRTGIPLTGRQVHGLVSDRHSLWTVQEALKSLHAIGLIHTEVVGRAGVHTINDDHVAVLHLRALVDPAQMLREVVATQVDPQVESVLVFGSVARGEATAHSDVDLAVIAQANWDGRIDLEDAVRSRLGNDCDVLTFTVAEFAQLANSNEPIVAEILRDGIALIGSAPQLLAGSSR